MRRGDELAHRLGAELDAPPRAVRFPVRRRRARAVSSRSPWSLLLPATAAVLYHRLGNRAASTDGSCAAPDVDRSEDRRDGRELAERMKTNPDDGDGWLLLGALVFRRIGRFHRLGGGVRASRAAPDRKMRRCLPIGRTCWRDAGRAAGGQAHRARSTARWQLDPDHREIAGAARRGGEERGDRPGAIAAYRRMRAEFPPGSEEAKELDGVLAELGAPPEPPHGRTGGNAPAPPPRRQPWRRRLPAAGAPAAAVATASVEGRVDIDAKLKARIESDDILFVFARNPAGSRMPLAVMRVPAAGEWPRAFVLTDAWRWRPARRSRRAKAVIIEARVSKGGTAMPQPGDLTGAARKSRPARRGVRVLIDRALP